MCQCAIVINVFVILMTSGDDKRLKQTLFSKIFIFEVPNFVDNLPYLICSQTLKALRACMRTIKMFRFDYEWLSSSFFGLRRFFEI